MNIHLLGIDWQNDFCDPKGTLFVPGADQDAQRMVAFLKRVGPKIDQIHFTLDSHQLTHVAHPTSWQDAKGCNPTPFTIITEDDVVKGVWRASNPRNQSQYLKYVQALTANKRYLLCIWPAHCLIGSWGHLVVPDIFNELMTWSAKNHRPIDFVTKGSNDYTEHYSAVQADVAMDWDPSTKLNTRLIDILQQADDIVTTGQALSHCVANTIRDIASNFGPDQVKKFVILTDASSNVPGFEGLGKAFIDDMIQSGARLSTTVDYLK